MGVLIEACFEVIIKEGGNVLIGDNGNSRDFKLYLIASHFDPTKLVDELLKVKFKLLNLFAEDELRSS